MMGRHELVGLNIFYVSVIDALVISERVETAVHSLANVTDRLP